MVMLSRADRGSRRSRAERAGPRRRPAPRRAVGPRDGQGAGGLADVHRRRRRRGRDRHRRAARPPRPRRPAASAGSTSSATTRSSPATRTTTRPTATATARTSPGIVAANRDNDEGITGVAPGARVLPLRVLDDNGEGYADDTIKAIDYAIDEHAQRDQPEPRRLHPAPVDAVRRPGLQGRARARGRRPGIVVVIAAGNNSLPKCENPDVDGIALRRRRGQLAATRSVFSSFGSNVDLMAPGGSGLGGSSEDVLSTYIDSGYESIAGTSQATPHVAGRRRAARLARAERAGRGQPDRRAPPRRPARRSCTARASWTPRPPSPGSAPPPADPGDPNPARRQLLDEARA